MATVEIWCRYCREFTPLIIGMIEADNDLGPDGIHIVDSYCPTCLRRLIRLRTDDPGEYDIVKIENPAFHQRI